MASRQATDLLDRWNELERVADDQARRLRYLDTLTEEVAVLDEQSSWAIARAMHMRPVADRLPFLPVMPIGKLVISEIVDALWLAQVAIDGVVCTPHVDPRAVHDNVIVPRGPYHIFDVDFEDDTEGYLLNHAQHRVPDGRRHLTTSEICALAIHATPGLLARIGFWGGAGSRHDDEKGYVWHPYVMLERGHKNYIKIAYGTPEHGDHLTWPTCREAVLD